MEQPISREARILVVDDEQPIRNLVNRAVQNAGYSCLTAGDGEEALEILSREPIDVVITDIAMPGMNGIELTRTIREKHSADVIVMTGYVEDYVFEDVIAGGASDFVQKPVSLKEMIIRLKRLLRERENIARRARIEEELRQSFCLLKRSLEDAISVLSRALEMRDPYTAGHQKRVTQLACLIGKEMGLNSETMDGIRLAGLVHDIGKINVPSEILTKPGRLSQIEHDLIRIHPEAGYDILKDIEFPWPIAEIVRQHHERMDGSGYPRGLTGDVIRIEARIIAVADVIDAMASHRPYRPAVGLEKALEEVEGKKGTLYDKDIVEACARVLEKNGKNLFM
jgi:putative nucleotidyltransferase with HDIG domain